MIYEPGISDRRDSRRYTYQAVVECMLPVEASGLTNERCFSAITENVSRDGLRLYSIESFEAGQKLYVRFESSASHEFTCYSVRWAEQVGPENYMAGVKRCS